MAFVASLDIMNDILTGDLTAALSMSCCRKSGSGAGRRIRRHNTGNTVVASTT